MAQAIDNRLYRARLVCYLQPSLQNNFVLAVTSLHSRVLLVRLDRFASELDSEDFAIQAMQLLLMTLSVSRIPAKKLLLRNRIVINFFYTGVLNKMQHL